MSPYAGVMQGLCSQLGMAGSSESFSSTRTSKRERYNAHESVCVSLCNSLLLLLFR